jgi:ankyrin repeat protein
MAIYTSIRQLIQRGADANASYAAFTPLYIAAANGHAKVVTELLAAGARDAYYGCRQTVTSLGQAAQNGHTAVVAALLASWFQRSHYYKHIRISANRTPLQWAARKGHTECTKLLVAAGNDEDGWSTADALRVAAKHGHVESVQRNSRERI